MSEKEGIDYGIWDVEIKGRENTIWEKYIIKGILTFPPGYPDSPPRFTFLNNFQHIHVYDDGAICLNLISENHWRHDIRVAYILN